MYISYSFKPPPPPHVARVGAECVGGRSKRVVLRRGRPPYGMNERSGSGHVPYNTSSAVLGFPQQHVSLSIAYTYIRTFHTQPDFHLPEPQNKKISTAGPGVRSRTHIQRGGCEFRADGSETRRARGSARRRPSWVAGSES